MKLPLWARPVKISFRHQMALIFTLGIICLAVASSVATSTLTSRTVRAQLLEQGRQAARNFATQSTLALLYSSADNAKDPARATLAFPDIHGVAIYDLQHRVLFAEGEPALPPTYEPQWPDKSQLDHETGEFWYFVTPVHADSRASDAEQSPFVAESRALERIGFVRVVMSKETLKALAGDALATNLVASITLAAGLLLVLLAVTTRVTTPLKNLASIMRRAASGEKQMRAELRGPRDLVEMEMAFNTMMSVLEEREQQLESARDAALESARVKGEFAANVSHELRTPLSGVLGMLELLHNMGLTPKQHEYVEVARNAGESLLVLVENILDFSRMASGKVKAQPVDFQLSETLDDVVGLLAAQAQRKELDLGYVIADDVPAIVRGEPDRLRQVLINLAGNAVKFTERGEVTIRLEVLSGSENQTLMRFEVRDTGIGIPKEAQRRIFDVFTQADGSTTRKYGGAGLGLAICRQLVDFMGGQIGVESEPEKGSTFWFTLPLAKPAQIPVPDTDSADLTGLRVLIIEDSESGSRFLEQTLGAWGVGYHNRAASAKQALGMLRNAAAQASPYEIALVSQAMRGMKGLDLVRQIANDPALARIKVIMMGNERRLSRGEAGLANIVGWVTKPVHESQLFDCIAKITHHDRKPVALGAVMNETEPRLGGRILVVEDNRANQQVAVGMLQRLGCRVEAAATGQEALELIVRRSFDLVLMDCHMPEMDGYEATRRIRALEEGSTVRLPILAMTANVRVGDHEKCLAAGMDGYLPKPLKLDALRITLAKWLAAGKVEVEDRAVAELPHLESTALNADEPPIDGERFNELRNSIGDAFIPVIEVFLQDTSMHLQSLKQAIAEQDAHTVAELAHAIKGSARNLGANRLVAVAKQLEDLGRCGSTEGAMETLSALISQYHLVCATLQPEIQPDDGGSPLEPADQPQIIIVDDDRGLRVALRKVLEEDGYRIAEARNGVQALGLCERQMPDLVLMDAMMPEMDGFTACTRMRDLRDGSHTPILIITALDDQQSIERAFGAGATDYIPKPVHFAVLRQRVARLLDTSRAERRVRRLAYHDPLTGLPNRTHFKERLEALLSQSLHQNHIHAILFLDLDRFKLVNDTLGHDVGDLLLKATAERITGCVRAVDMVARLGGDEFTIILENISSSKVAAGVAEKICRVMSKPFVFMGQEVYISSSIGISVYPTDAKDGGTLVKHADMAMFRAKELGDQFRFYDDSLEASVSKRLALESELRRALERNEFLLHYQPQIDLGTGKIIGMEALIRWQHPERGLVSPAQFIALAEETGLIVPMGAWALHTACAQNRDWQAAGLPPITVAVNLSARQLGQSEIDRRIASILSDVKLDPRFLELELTETAIMRDPEEMLGRLRRLKEIGVVMSIDDFGTGYSSLSYLRHLPFDKLKIDQSFIRNVTSNANDAAITLTIINMGHSLKLRVIAEGVETEGQLRYLQLHGCQEIQGYYFSRPLGSEEATKLLREDRRLPTLETNYDRIETLLVVDDKGEVTSQLLRELGGNGYRILTAGSARQAFELLATEKIHVVISEQALRDIDGIDFLSRVKELHPHTVRILLTSYTELDTVTRAVNEGWIYKLIAKPWNNEQLCKHIREAFAQYQREKKSRGPRLSIIKN